MINKAAYFLGLIFLISLIAACGTQIGVKTEFKKASFEVGKTTKASVIDYLGLPQKMLKDKEGRDHYFYEGSTHLIGACIGCGNVNGGVGLIPSLVNQANIDNGAEYVFDLNGILATKFESK